MGLVILGVIVLGVLFGLWNDKQNRAYDDYMSRYGRYAGGDDDDEMAALMMYSAMYDDPLGPPE